MKKLLLIASLLGASALMAQGNLAACTGCHGKNFEKHALGKSKIVKDMSKEDITKALKGYKDGTYGGPMKGLMVGQVKNVTDTDQMAEMVYAKAHGDKHPGKTKCLNKLESIIKCVKDAKGPDEMQKCRESLVQFSEKVKKMHNIKN